MFEERKINPELLKQYREQGYWKNETLLDCWERAAAQYRTGNMWWMTVVTATPTGNWTKRQAG